MRLLFRSSAAWRRVLVSAGAAMAAGAALLSQAGGAQAATAAPAYVPAGTVIHFGARGPAVKALQQRLNQLDYYAGPADGQYGTATVEAVWAFKEVQGLGTRSNPDDVGIAMQRALVHPKAPKALVPHGGATRIEVNQTNLTLVLWKNGKVNLISHVSTGGGYSYCDPGGSCGNVAHTPDGNYRTLSYLPGWVKVPLGEMFKPVFFIGRAYAIHGDTSVPLYAASHGCVRIPMDIANFFHTKMPLGTPVYIRGAV
jgi:lipoprotein-anchoring transpeptidase ErfK/SrfK